MIGLKFKIEFIVCSIFTGTALSFREGLFTASCIQPLRNNRFKFTKEQNIFCSYFRNFSLEFFLMMWEDSLMTTRCDIKNCLEHLVCFILKTLKTRAARNSKLKVKSSSPITDVTHECPYKTMLKSYEYGISFMHKFSIASKFKCLRTSTSEKRRKKNLSSDFLH